MYVKKLNISFPHAAQAGFYFHGSIFALRGKAEKSFSEHFRRIPRPVNGGKFYCAERYFQSFCRFGEFFGRAGNPIAGGQNPR